MADDEVLSIARRNAPFPSPQPKGASPLVAGALYGAAGLALGGPIGLLAGLVAGVASKRNRDNQLDRYARSVANLRDEQTSLNSEIAGELELADEDEKRLLLSAKRTATDGYLRLQAGDEAGAQMIEQANALIRGVISGDVAARKTEQAARFNDQRQLVGKAAQDLRNEYSLTVNQARDVDKLSQRVFELTADPKFDPAKPINRAILSQLINAGVSDTFRDDPSGFLEGVSEAGQGSIVGGLAKGLDTLLDAEDFKVSREDFNRLALNSRKIVSQYAEQRLSEIRAQATNLNTVSQRSGLTDKDYDLGEYVSGSSKDLRIAPPAIVPNQTRSTQPLATATATASAKPGTAAQAREELQNAKDRLSARRRRPTN